MVEGKLASFGGQMEPLTASAIAIATIILTKGLDGFSEKLGETVLEQCGKLIKLLKTKQKLQLLTGAVEENHQQRLDYGEAVLELKAATDKDPEIAQAVQDVEVAVNSDRPDNVKKVKELVEKIKSQPSVVNHFAKLAEEIKAEKGAMVAQSITIDKQTNHYT